MGPNGDYYHLSLTARPVGLGIVNATLTHIVSRPWAYTLGCEGG